MSLSVSSRKISSPRVNFLMKMTAQVLLMCRKQSVFERVCSIIQPASVMREDGFILAKRKIDFLTQEMKDRERARKEIEAERQTERERARQHMYSIMHNVKVS